ncbi:MAG: DoxX family protein [Niabella sp.]
MKLLNTKLSDNRASLGLLLLRVATGSAMLINHGLKKISGFNTILEKGFADPFHIGAKASLSLTVFAEVFCAILIILGLTTRLASIPLIIAMFVALFIAHGGEIFGQGELAAIYLSIFFMLLLAGPGKYSVDKLISK